MSWVDSDVLPNYVVVDLETSIKNKTIGSNKASPFWPDNKVVLSGRRVKGSRIDTSLEWPASHLTFGFLFVGQNIKFDLLHMLTNGMLEKEDFKNLQIWDTQLVEYLITAQQSKYAKLDDLSVKYGGKLKDDKIKELWDAGVDTEDIDKDMLCDYLEGDLCNTEIVFLSQFLKVDELGIQQLVYDQMEALLATTIMEYNGLQFDMEGAITVAIDLTSRIEAIENEMKIISPIPDFNINSPKEVGILLFGGAYKRDETETIVDSEGEPVRYKTGARAGAIKTRKCWVNYHFDGIVPKSKYTCPTTPTGAYQVSEKVLKELCAIPSIDSVIPELILEHRNLNKDCSTYYVGYSALVFPDGKIHPNYNHTATNTGRLSCTQPNLQNASGGD